METTESPKLALNREKKEEKKGAGFLSSFLSKLGLGGAPGGAGAGISVGGVGAASGSGGFGLGGGILATKAGIVALILTGTTIAAGVGVVGRSVLSGRAGGVSESIYSLFPGKTAPGTAGAPASGAAGGVSSSLDYMSQAARNDSMLKEQAASAEGAAVSASADATAPGQVMAPDNANRAANVGSASPGVKLQKTAGFANAGSGGGGGSMSSAAPGAGGRNSSNAARVGGLNAMSRNMASSGDGRRSLIGSRGTGAGGQLQHAFNDGKLASARNPATARSGVGTTFDNSGGIQSSAAGTPSAMTGGGVDQGGRSRFAPNKVLDQREVPPVKKVDTEKDVTAYKPYMYAAMAALALAMILGMVAGKKKDAAKAAPPQAAAAMYAEAATWHWLAAAAAAVAMVMGVILMTGFGQTMQGLIFTGIGGFLAFTNAKNALDMSKGAADAKENEGKALETAKARQLDINNQLKPDYTDANGNPLTNEARVNLQHESADLTKQVDSLQKSVDAAKPPVDPQPAQAQPAQTQPAQAQPAQTQPAQAQPAQTQPAQAQPAGQQSAAIDPHAHNTITTTNNGGVTEQAINGQMRGGTEVIKFDPQSMKSMSDMQVRIPDGATGIRVDNVPAGTALPDPPAGATGNYSGVGGTQLGPGGKLYAAKDGFITYLRNP